MKFAGAVLAGGRSTRMGQDKAGLMVGGETLLNRQLRLLREAGASELFVVVAAGREAPPALPEGVRTISDRVADAGPLAGIDAALSAASCPLVLMLAVDLPAMTAGWLRQLIDLCHDGRGAVPVVDGRYEPLAAVYPQSLAAEARARMDRGELALQSIVDQGIAAAVLKAWKVESEIATVLVNWNRLGDWEQRP